MHTAVVSRTGRNLATAAPSAYLTRAFSVNSRSIPPKNAAQAASDSTPRSPTSEDHDRTHTDAPPSSASNTPGDTPKLSESDVLETPIPPSSTTLSLDFAPPEPGTERERTGAKSSKDSLSSIERRRRQLGRVSFGLFALGLVSGGIYLGRQWTEDELVSRRSVRAPPLNYRSTSCRLSCSFYFLFFLSGVKLCPIHDGVVRPAGSHQCSTYGPIVIDDALYPHF
jgi:hypothetical protein